MKQPIVPSLLLCPLALVLVSACSSSSSTAGSSDSGADGSSADSGSALESGSETDSGDSDGGATADSASADGGTGINGCATYVDHTADAAVTLTWDLQVASRPDHCAKIKVGSKVTWAGDFTVHPLLGSGGDSANPITSGGVSGNSSVEIAFPVAGTYGYICGEHATMLGAIQVVP